MSSTSAASLAAETPENWFDGGFEPLYAMSWRDYEENQPGAHALRFESLGQSVVELEKLAKREGISAIEHIEDMLPLLFGDRV